MKGVADRTLELMNEFQKEQYIKGYLSFQHFLVVKIETLEDEIEKLKRENEYLYRYAEEGGMDTDKFFEFTDAPLNECPRCHGTGGCDSGATDPQGNWIQIECECQREESG